MGEFIRLQLKLKWGYNRNNNKASAIMTAIAALLAVLIALALVAVLTYVLRASIGVKAKPLSELYLTLIMAALTIVATGMQVNRLYRPGDMLITARFPLSPFKLFAGYLILNYIDLTIYSVIFVLPVMLVFGFTVQCLSVVYIIGTVLGALFMPLIPFALSIFIAIPAVYFMEFLARHGAVRLVLFVLCLIGAFFLYYFLLNELAQFFLHRNWEEGTLEIWESILKALDSYYNPAYYLGNIIFFDKFWIGLAVVLGGGAWLTGCGVFLASAVCTELRNKALDSGTTGRQGRYSRIDGYGSGHAILRYTFREIVRTKTYSYFYLGVAISTPVMVFFCNRLVTMVGEGYIGSGINFGASMLVVAVFMAMICSFTATVLSVEGKTFYITKLVPVGYRKQLFIKGLLNIVVSAVALAISTIVLVALDFLTYREMWVLIGTQFVLAAGLVFNGINMNLANPNLKPKANGEAEEINITYMLLIGLVLAAIIGAGCIILPRVYEENGAMFAYMGAGAVAAVYMLINVVVFFCTANKKYRKIEV